MTLLGKLVSITVTPLSAQASVLLGEVLRHAAATAPDENSRPEKRDPATHAVYRVIATWNTESDIVKNTHTASREMKAVSSQGNSCLCADEKGTLQLARQL